MSNDKLTVQQRREIFWAMKKKEAFKKRNYPKRIRDFQPVEGVQYRASPTTGMQRPVKGQRGHDV